MRGGQPRSLGGCRYGIGRWDEMARDERLRLGAKLAVAAVEKGRSKDAAVDADQKHLPKGKPPPPLVSSLLRLAAASLCL